MNPFTSIPEASSAIHAREISCVELLQATFDGIAAWEPHVEALLDRAFERAMTRAHQLDEELEAGQSRGPLHGIPLVIKDLIDVEGMITTAGSKLLADNIATSDARIVRRLIEAGAVVPAKANTHEFGYGALTPPTKNPWALDRMPGGSSGGPAAAVAARMVLGSIGTDNAGSIREPAALCGVVGLKPTNGLVSDDGVYQLTWSMGSIGPLAVDVAGARMLFDAISGPPAAGMQPSSDRGVRRVGIPTELLQPSMPYVRSEVERVASVLSDDGLDVFECSIGDLDEAVAVAFLTLGSEALAIHRNWLDERGEEYSGPVHRYLVLAEAYSAVDYLNAQRLRQQLKDRVDRLFEQADILLGPAQLVVAPLLSDSVVRFPTGEELPRDLTLVRPLIPFSLTGHPALSLPVGLQEGMPIGVQLVAPLFAERVLLDFAVALEGMVGWGFPAPAVPG